MSSLLKFFREAFAELEHVAWPTPAETKRYFMVVVIFMTVAAAAVFAVVSALSGGLFAAKDAINPTVAPAAAEAAKNFDLDKLPMSVEATAVPASK